MAGPSPHEQSGMPTPASRLAEIKELQDFRQWDDMLALAEAAFVDPEPQDPEFVRRYCQALIEVGQLEAANTRLQQLADGDHDQVDEALGLLGRVAKQRWVGSGRPDHLGAAIAAYVLAFREGECGDPAWVGANLLALDRARSRIEDSTGRELDPIPTAAAAKAITSRMGDNPNRFEMASGVELALHERRDRDAEQILGELLERGDNKPFELASLRRQLIDVWHLDRANPLVAAVSDRLIVTGLPEGIESSAGNARRDLEGVVGGNRDKRINDAESTPHNHYRRGLVLSQLVCMITDRSGYGLGTGFLIPGAMLAPRLDPRNLVLVTCAHVVSEPQMGASLPPNRARAVLWGLGRDHDAPKIRGLTQLMADPETDVAIFDFDQEQVPPELEGVRLDIGDPVDLDEPGGFVNLIGYPGGHRLSFSIRGNELLDASETKLQYAAPTAAGHSGSPVFDREWDLIGMHQQGSPFMPKLSESGVRPANQGATIGAIQAAAARALTGDEWPGAPSAN